MNSCFLYFLFPTLSACMPTQKLTYSPGQNNMYKESFVFFSSFFLFTCLWKESPQNRYLSSLSLSLLPCKTHVVYAEVKQNHQKSKWVEKRLLTLESLIAQSKTRPAKPVANKLKRQIDAPCKEQRG